MKIGWLVLLFSMMACSELVEKPKNLVTKDQMAILMAEMSINDQSYLFNPKDQREGETKYILNKHKVSSEAFTNSYTYYLATGETDDVIDRAQNIILSKDPKLKEYIQKKEEILNPIDKTK